MRTNTYISGLKIAVVIVIFVHTSQACADWKIIDPPIVFGEMARLSCLVEPSSKNLSTPTWTGGANYSLISFHDSTANKNKYRVINTISNNHFESVLEISDFSESDVNCDYSCSFGFHENRKRLGLTEEDFVFPIKSKTTTVVSTLRNGNLDVYVELRTVYPIPDCHVHFNGKEITNRLETHVRMDGIFHSVTETLHHYFNDGACTGFTTVSCDVGVKHFSVYKKTLNTCKEETMADNKEHTVGLPINWSVVGGVIVAVILLLFCIVAYLGISKYGKLKRNNLRYVKTPI